MKKLVLVGLLFSLHSLWAQESTFYGNVSPGVAKLVPAEESVPKNGQTKIVPNFKGRELVINPQGNHHNPDWVWQQHSTTEKTSSASVLWQMTGLGAGISPPDPTGEADSTVYIQSTNGNSGGIYKIFNKATGAAISGSLNMVSLSSPSVAGLGDPIVLYYKPAKRWFLTQFSSSGNKLLIYVSQTSNPQGAYYFYQFTCPSFPDYPKYSFCQSSDAFLASTNEGGAPRVYAMKLSALLSGTTSPFIGVATGYALNGFGFQTITPVDLEGDLPAPTGQKPLFVRHRDDEVHSNGSPDSPTNDWIEIWEMTINWTNNTATVAKIQDVAIAEIDSDLCGLTSFSCMGQPGTTVKLDPLREAVMFKAPMRVFSDHQAMVLCLTTDVNGNNRGGVRWLELRRPTGSTGTWTLYQEGTYAPGTTLNRWMANINIDKYGNILLAYSTSGTTAPDYPSIQMTGRKPCDPLGTMTVPETMIKAGTTARTANTRWGDYHHMCIDDFDGLTFYYTGVVTTTGGQITTNLAALRMNPDVNDAAIINAFTTQANGCGSSTQIAVVIENRGTAGVSTGSFNWQIGTGSATTVNYTSSQLTAVGSLDTILVSISGLQTGSNSLTFTHTGVNGITPDDNTCNDVFTMTLSITGSSSISVNPVTQQASCTSQDGSITLNTTGASGNVSYSLNNGPSQSSNVFNNLAAGTYTYVVTDASGCTASGSVSVAASATVTASISQTSNITCAGNQTATLVVTPNGGTAPYAFMINNGADQPSNTFANLGAGVYTITVLDANGCSTSIQYTITQPTAITVNAIPTTISCNGLSNGSITATATGGTPAYTYSLNGGTPSTSPIFSNLAAGNYTITATDANGCQQAFTTTIIEPSAVTLTGTATVSNGNDGTISLTAAGGNSPYTYSIDGVNYYSGSLFANLGIATYTCYVKDNNGCITSIEVTVNSSSLTELSFELVELVPNPNNGVFEIHVSGVQGSEVQGKLYTVSGQLVSTFKLNVQDGKIDQTLEMSYKLAAGSYYLGIYDGQHAAIKQFVKQ
ncbi:MAG: hypothetical protein RLZZ301_226 [Bacteroidota bacterium]